LSDLGFYSIVRYVDDVERGETVNVGVLLEADDNVLLRFLPREDLRARNDAVTRFAGLLETLIERREFKDAQESGEASPLAALSHRRFPHFEITEPRQIALNGDTAAAIADDLVRRLASDPAMSAV
jgi:DUF3037 family protein